jgi:hypothetical protein
MKIKNDAQEKIRTHVLTTISLLVCGVVCGVWCLVCGSWWVVDLLFFKTMSFSKSIDFSFVNRTRFDCLSVSSAVII